MRNTYVILVFILFLFSGCNDLTLQYVLDGMMISVPEVVSTFPAHEKESVSTDIIIQVFFSKPMQMESLNRAIQLMQDASVVPISLELSENDTLLSITPQTILDIDTTYTLHINKEAMSSDNRQLSKAAIISFSTSSLSLIPTLDIVTPENGTINVNLDEDIIISSSIQMDLDSLREEISVYHGDSTEAEVIITEIENSLYRIAPAIQWDAETEYTISISGNASAYNGVPTGNQTTSIFTTGVLGDRIPPLPIQNVTQNRYEDTRAYISWNPSADPLNPANSDLLGYVIVRTENQLFAGTPERKAYLANETMGNGVVLDVVANDIETYIDNGV
jgi:hypothetical protein